MTTVETYTLHNGLTIPAIGFGTWQIPDGAPAYDAVTQALKVGYHHIDTAQTYDNEGSVGQAITDSGISREEIFLTTKIWNTQATYEDTIASFEESLTNLQTDYVDLLLIHWPNPAAFRDKQGYKERNKEVWRALEHLYKQGKTRSIGVSNFLIPHLDALLETAKVIPMVNQIKLAPSLTQDDLVNYCKKNDILLEAYSPLGTGDIFDNAVLQAIAEKYHKSVAQIALKWSLEHDFLPLPRSETPKNILSNLNIFDFVLSKPDIEIIDNISGLVEEPNPDTKPF